MSGGFQTVPVVSWLSQMWDLPYKQRSRPDCVAVAWIRIFSLFCCCLAVFFFGETVASDLAELEPLETVPVRPVYGGGAGLAEDLFRVQTYIHYEVVVLVCTGGEEAGLVVGGGGGSPTVLAIYTTRAYKNLQGDSSVFPRTQRTLG